MRARRGKALRGWIMATTLLGLVGACVFPPEAVHGPCKQDTDCTDDGNPCTRGVCDVASGFCSGVPQDLPFGDKGCDDNNPCTDEICQAGVCAHKAATTSPDDGNECTNDSCSGGKATHTAVADGTACGAGDSLKCTNGKCNCTMATECGTSTECLKFECVNSECKSTSLEAGTQVDGKEPGDCLKNVCDGANNVITVPDLMDVPADPTPNNCKKKACDMMLGPIDVDDPTDAPPDDGKVCTTEGCNGGVPINYKPVADGAACGAGPTCVAAAGGGYEANAGDSCVNGLCVTPASVSCGNYKCNAAGTACLGACQDVNQCIAGMFCDAPTNSCKPFATGGMACQDAAACQSNFCVDGVCCNTQCGGLCQRCDLNNKKGLCSPVPNKQDPDNECNGGDACDGAGQCRKPDGAGCAMDADCLSNVCEDSICCNVSCPGACKRCDIGGSNGTCTNVAKDMEPPMCVSPKACDGNGNCETKTGQPCGADAECMSGSCQDGVCCNNNCPGACARCDLMGTMGICTNVPSNVQVSGCNATEACDGNNNCELVNGQACTQNSQCVSGYCVDEDLATAGTQGVCCDSACAGTCKSCAGAKTVGGMSGVCDNIKNKEDPDDECAGACMANNGKGCCNGMGVCISP